MKIFRTILRILKMEDHIQASYSIAADHNKDPILSALKLYIPQYIKVSWPRNDGDLHCLEVSSGSGQHVAFFADEFQMVTFQPSEHDRSLFSSIKAHSKKKDNVLLPIFIDISQPFTSWETPDFVGESKLDFIININMIHITPMSCTEGLFSNSGKILRKNGLLFTYGPYAMNGKIEPRSNKQFDASLRKQDPAYGIRDVRTLVLLATGAGLRLVDTVAMPANNHFLVWKKE